MKQRRPCRRGSRQPWRSVPGCARFAQPDPQPGQVLVRIEASAVNPLDIKFGPARPLTRASRCCHSRHRSSGVVEAVVRA